MTTRFTWFVVFSLAQFVTADAVFGAETPVLRANESLVLKIGDDAKVRPQVARPHDETELSRRPRHN